MSTMGKPPNGRCVYGDTMNTRASRLPYVGGGARLLPRSSDLPFSSATRRDMPWAIGDRRAQCLFLIASFSMPAAAHTI